MNFTIGLIKTNMWSSHTTMSECVWDNFFSFLIWSSIMSYFHFTCSQQKKNIFFLILYSISPLKWITSTWSCLYSFHKKRNNFTFYFLDLIEGHQMYKVITSLWSKPTSSNKTHLLSSDSPIDEASWVFVSDMGKHILGSFFFVYHLTF